VYVTSWLYRKTKVSAGVTYGTVPLGQYQKATLKVTVADDSQLPLISRVVKYAIYDGERELGRYPLDDEVMAGAAHYYIKKDQNVKFVLDDGYDHLLDIRTVKG
jgi:hypothetical protein